MDKNVILVDEIMGAIDQTEEWDRIQQEDPRILHKTKQLNACLVQLSQYAPNEVVVELEGTAYGFADAFASAAMLYGIHVADAIRDVAARPADLSRHVLKRMAANHRK